MVSSGSEQFGSEFRGLLSSVNEGHVSGSLSLQANS